MPVRETYLLQVIAPIIKPKVAKLKIMLAPIAPAYSTLRIVKFIPNIEAQNAYMKLIINHLGFTGFSFFFQIYQLNIFLNMV